MAAALVRRMAGELVRLPSLQSVRHGSKAVTRHKKAMHFERQKLLAVTQYIPPKKGVPAQCLHPQSDAADTEEENPLERLFVSQMNAVLQECKMVAVFQKNAISAEDFLLLKHRLLKHGIHVKTFPNKVVKKSLAHCNFQAMEPLFQGQTLLIVSHEVKTKELLKCVRKVPQIVLLGACIERRLLSRQGLQAYSRLPSLETLRSQVAGTLSLMASQTSSLLTQHSSLLCSQLDQHIKEEREKQESP